MVTASKTMQRAGVVLIVCSLAFVAVFIILARAFSYPEVLRWPADKALPALLAGGWKLRAVWFIYAVLPLGIVYAGAASAPLLARAGRLTRLIGVGAAVAAGFAMTTGLVRWPTAEWSLARTLETAQQAEARRAVAASYDTLNFVFGNIIGEFCGEIFLSVWFLCVALALRAYGRRILGAVGIAAAIVLAVAAFRNITDAVSVVAQVNNVTLP